VRSLPLRVQRRSQGSGEQPAQILTQPLLGSNANFSTDGPPLSRAQRLPSSPQLWHFAALPPATGSWFSSSCSPVVPTARGSDFIRASFPIASLLRRGVSSTAPFSLSCTNSSVFPAAARRCCSRSDPSEPGRTPCDIPRVRLGERLFAPAPRRGCCAHRCRLAGGESPRDIPGSHRPSRFRY
jgi:hypothetical protein